MYWLATRTAVFSLSKLRSLAFLRYSPAFKFSSLTPSSPSRFRHVERVYCFKSRKSSKGAAVHRGAKKMKALDNVLDDKDLSHLVWWKEVGAVQEAFYLAADQTACVFKLVGIGRQLGKWDVGYFYEPIGIDACILVEYAGLNPFGGLRSDAIPKAGCPVVNLRQTLDDLTRNGYSVCIVEEVQGQTQARTRKDRFISGHISFRRGYCITSVLETMKTYSSEDSLAEETLVTKLCTCRYHHLFLHTSLRENSSGTCRWGEFGEGGLLWGECSARHFEWFEGNPVTDRLFKVRELYGLDENTAFRNVTVSSENRPCPLHLGTATQIGGCNFK